MDAECAFSAVKPYHAALVGDYYPLESRVTQHIRHDGKLVIGNAGVINKSRLKVDIFVFFKLFACVLQADGF